MAMDFIWDSTDSGRISLSGSGNDTRVRVTQYQEKSGTSSGLFDEQSLVLDA